MSVVTDWSESIGWHLHERSISTRCTSCGSYRRTTSGSHQTVVATRIERDNRHPDKLGLARVQAGTQRVWSLRATCIDCGSDVEQVEEPRWVYGIAANDNCALCDWAEDEMLARLGKPGLAKVHDSLAERLQHAIAKALGTKE